jgi:hypothetical protein
MPAETSSSSFGFFATPLNPVSPGPGGINAMSPLPEFVPAFPAAAEFPLPLGTVKSPPDRSVPSSLPPEKPALRFARFPFAPRQPFTFWQSAFGSSFQVRYVSPGSTVPVTSLERGHFCPPLRDQMSETTSKVVVFQVRPEVMLISFVSASSSL